jgi:tetratricopeptide (TPR) repeat protein
VPALHHLSLACFTLGDRAAGLDLCKRILRVDPKFVPAMHNMAVAYVHDRRWRRARYWVAQARRVDPVDPSLKRLGVKLAAHALGGALAWLGGAAASLVVRRRRPRT